MPLPLEKVKRLKVGEIPYLNCAPIFHTLRKFVDRRRYSFVRGTPANLNKLLAWGKIDAAPCSSIEYALHPDRYVLIPDISISARGPIKSVLLFSRRPLKELNGRPVAITPASASGAMLLQIIFKKFLGFSPCFVHSQRVVSSIPGNCDAALVIGDNALKNKKTAPYVIDLGTIWKKYTRTYCVFSLWIARRDAFECSPASFQRLHSDLLAAKTIARWNLPQLAREFHRPEWMTKHELIDYWKTISFDLGASHIKGLKTFYRYAHEIKGIRRVPPLKFIVT